MKDYGSVDLHYSYLLGLYSANNDNETLEELHYLNENYKNFPFEKFVAGVYKKEIIEYYGLEFLIKTSKYRTIDIFRYGMLGGDEKTKVIFFLENPNFKKVNEDLVKFFDLTQLKEISELLKGFYISSFINYCVEHGYLSLITNVIARKIEYQNLKFLYEYFDIENSNELVLSIISSEEFNSFIKYIDTKYLNSSLKLKEFLILYKNYRIYFEKIPHESINIHKDKLNAALFSGSIINFNLMIDISTFYEYRYRETLKLIESKSPYEIKKIISRIYFNCDFEELDLILDDLSKMLKKKKISEISIEKYFLISSILTYEDAVLFLSSIKEESNIVYCLESYKQKIASEDIVNRLSGFAIKKSNDIVYLNGESFLFLLHKIKGYGNYSLANELYTNPSVWTSAECGADYIATSLCYEKYFGLVDGIGYTLGFTSVTPDLIIGMGPEDIYMSSRVAHNNIRHNKNRFMLTNDLLEASSKLYNEVDVKRRKGKRLIIPDLVFAKDNYNTKDREVSDYFNVPIYVLLTHIYAKQMNEYLEYLLSKNKFKLYINQLAKMYFSFRDCPSICYKYFRDDILISKIERIVDKYLSYEIIDIEKLFELSNMVKSFSNFLDAKAYLEHTYNLWNIEDLMLRIDKKKIYYGGSGKK